jgi:hypothetical protein
LRARGDGHDDGARVHARPAACCGERLDLTLQRGGAGVRGNSTPVGGDSDGLRIGEGCAELRPASLTVPGDDNERDRLNDHDPDDDG